MAVFPSREWCLEAMAKVNADPESPKAGEGWVGDFGLVIEAEPPHLTQPFTLYLRPNGGRIEKLEILADPDDLDEIEPVYLARAPYSVWKGLLKGTVDPVEAVLKRRISLRGDLQPVMERMKYRGIADRVLASLSTRFIDEGGVGSDGAERPVAEGGPGAGPEGLREADVR